MSTLAPSTYSLQNFMVDLPPDPVIFGSSGVMQRLREKVEKFASTDLPVLVEGESGAGKDVLARWIHARSARSGSPFIKTHCPAISSMSLESELFGYERGAFTGALKLKPGQVEMAQGGTLFLDEISGVEPGLQARLLRLLQEGSFARVGGSQEHHADVRFICSTHLSLSGRARSGVFRQDRFYRMNAVHLRLPPLRKRLEDVPALAKYMVAACGRKYNVPVRPLSKDIMNLLQASSWPANLRQLENMVRRYVVLGCDEETISAELLGQTAVDRLPGLQTQESMALKKLVREHVKEQERKIILRALHNHHWNRKETANALGITYQALLYKMRQDQLSPTRGTAAREELPGTPGFVN
ncbi:MAG: sigma 54-interacting transcriptional regulator [Terriglobia bacterium]